jgi:hypothetical protein
MKKSNAPKSATLCKNITNPKIKVVSQHKCKIEEQEKRGAKQHQ